MQHDKGFQAPAEFLSMGSVDVARGQKVVLQDINLKLRPASTWQSWGLMAAESRR
jgi:ABC-type molybdenum transport system ATPase subunit/photorepair protein PhrA